LALLGSSLYVAVLTVLPVFRFPRPGGPYAIGTVTYHWVDTGRPEIFSEGSGEPRELMAQVWYPAEDVGSSPRAPYVSDPDAVTAGLSQVFGMPRLLFRAFESVTTNAVSETPVASAEPQYPVLVFLEGLGGYRQMNTFQVEELVSHGYVVVALDQPYTAAAVRFPDGRVARMSPLEEMKPLVRQSYAPAEDAPTLHGNAMSDGIVPYLAQDVTFALDRLESVNQQDPRGRLTGRLDLRRAGVFGVSLGGIVAGEACRREPRLGACLVMDAPMPTQVVRHGLDQPTMWITRPAEDMRLEREQAGGWPEDEIEAHQHTMRAVFEKLPGDGYFVNVHGMFHLNPTDMPLWSPLFSWLNVIGPIEAERAHTIVNAYSVAFFDRHLRHRRAAILDAGADRYPEADIQSHRPTSTGPGQG
jgi:pimeloyl-ACP methyl ester carboxylesterase